MNEACRSVRFIASAGTGKTYQVVNLYQSLLLGRPYPRDDAALPGVAAGGIYGGGSCVPPERILMLTFTRNAAAEMRSRVTEAIERDVTSGDAAHEAFCWSLLRRLSGATIATIHAFAQQLLTHHALELGLSPSLQVMEEADAATLRREEAQATLRSVLAGDDTEYARAIARLCDGHGMEAVVTGVLQTIQQCSIWAIDLEDTEPASLVLRPKRPSLADLHDLLRRVQGRADAGGGKTVQSMAAGLRAAVEALGRDPTPESVAAAAGDLRDGMGGGRWGNDDQAKALRLAVKTTLDRLAGYPLRVAATGLFTALVTLARDSARAIRIRKCDQGVLDFDDLLVQACGLLRRHPETAPPTEVIIVDEAQDNSRLQNEFVLRLRSATNAAVVACGDAKQTIYAWRGADLGGLDRLGQTLGLCPVPLRTSYRSQKCLLDWVNDIFARVILGPELYGANEELQPCPAAVTESDAAVELLLPRWEVHPSPQDEITVPGVRNKAGEDRSSTCPRITLRNRDIEALARCGSGSGGTDWARVAELAEDALSLEARAVARRIRLLTSPQAGAAWHPAQVWDSAADTWVSPNAQPYRFRDILILLRATTRQEIYEQALQEEHIPFTTDGAGRGFFARQEVQDVSSLLSWLAFPYDRQAWTGLLRSPFCSLSDNAVAVLSDRLNALSPRGLIAIPEAEAEFLARRLGSRSSSADAAAFRLALPVLRRLSRLAGRVSAVDLVRESVRLTGYDAILAGTFHGVQRLANLQKLLSWIQERERAENLDMQAVARRLGDEIAGKREVPDAAVLDPDDDSVRINTVHAAKGLSSPVVIVPDLRRRPRSDAHWIHTLRDVEGHGAALAARLKFYDDDDELQDRADTEGFDTAVAARETERDQESRRLFYVAATRARDLLIFSSENPGGSEENWRVWINRHLLACAFDPRLVRLRSYDEVERGWRALDRQPARGDRILTERLIEGRALLKRPDGPERYRFRVTALTQGLSSYQPGSLDVVTRWDGEGRSATEARLMGEDDAVVHAAQADAPRLPESEGRGGFPSAARFGTLAHRVLERLDYFSGVSLKRQIQAAPEVAGLAPGERREMLRPLEAAATAIAGRLKGVAREDLIREMPFVARFTHDGAEVTVDGKVDLVFFKDGGWHVSDYKFSEHSTAELAARYALQLAAYGESLWCPCAMSPLRTPRFATRNRLPATVTLSVLGISRAGVCSCVEVGSQPREAIAAQLVDAARRLAMAAANHQGGGRTPAAAPASTCPPVDAAGGSAG